MYADFIDSLREITLFYKFMKAAEYLSAAFYT